jgi:hypothetical protein
MTLTLDISPELDAARRKALASVLSDAGLITPDQAAELVPEAHTTALWQGSPEWKALLYRDGPAHGVVLSPEATSREAIYDEELP